MKTNMKKLIAMALVIMTVAVLGTTALADAADVFVELNKTCSEQESAEILNMIGMDKLTEQDGLIFPIDFTTGETARDFVQKKGLDYDQLRALLDQ